MDEATGGIASGAHFAPFVRRSYLARSFLSFLSFTSKKVGLVAFQVRAAFTARGQPTGGQRCAIGSIFRLVSFSLRPSEPPPYPHPPAKESIKPISHTSFSTQPGTAGFPSPWSLCMAPWHPSRPLARLPGPLSRPLACHSHGNKSSNHLSLHP